MKYQALKHKPLKLEGKAQIELDAEDDALVLIPEEGNKVYLHWKTDTGKLAATYTMTFPTKVEGKVTLINALNTPAKITVVW
jgi:hypothetical protein